jgi:hypothetical protein
VAYYDVGNGGYGSFIMNIQTEVKEGVSAVWTLSYESQELLYNDIANIQEIINSMEPISYFGNNDKEDDFTTFDSNNKGQVDNGYNYDSQSNSRYTDYLSQYPTCMNERLFNCM